MDQKLGTNTPTIEMPSSVTSNTNQTNPGLPLKTADQDVALLIIVSCLAFVLLVAMVIFIVIMWRRANVNQHTQEETHIYDAYHHDNGSLGPDPLGEDHSYYAPANGSILT
ncbi:uncharacterized protein LOC117327169 [Pecten maximus]|uniref:uncharacterized protein LOC117327169 n=1 Tax=Pecten maximus TaxID=6579 RepID=UPI0014585396|nr:uncharacterized protein LOC117327169 [Pecten maximus]